MSEPYTGVECASCKHDRRVHTQPFHGGCTECGCQGFDPQKPDELDDLVLGNRQEQRRITKDQIAAIDRLWWSPQERALGIHNLVENTLIAYAKENPKRSLPSSWDKFCYAVELVAQNAVAINDEPLLDIARKLTTWVYEAHYSNAPQLYGPPDKKRVVDKAKKESKEAN